MIFCLVGICLFGMILKNSLLVGKAKYSKNLPIAIQQKQNNDLILSQDVMRKDPKLNSTKMINNDISDEIDNACSAKKSYSRFRTFPSYRARLRDLKFKCINITPL